MHLPRFIANPILPCLSACLHRLPFKTRLGGISTVTAMTCGLYSMHDTRTAVLRNGIKLPVKLSDYNGRMLYLFGTPDPKIIAVCKSLIRPGDVFLDIGANFGTVGLLTHDALGPDGAMHFVEPQPELAKVINDAIGSVSISNATVHNCGIWDEDGELTLTRPDQHTGAASISDSDQSSVKGESFQVPVRAIDSFLDESVGDKSFGAKVDVEGAEPKILPTILSHPALRFVVFECNVASVRDHVGGMLSQDDIKFFGLRKHLFRTRVRPITTRDDLNQSHDVIAVRIKPGQTIRGEFHPARLAPMLEDQHANTDMDTK